MTAVVLDQDAERRVSALEAARDADRSHCSRDKGALWAETRVIRDDVAAVAQDVAWIRGRIVGLVAIGTLLGTIAGGVVVGVLVAVLTHAR